MLISSGLITSSIVTSAVELCPDSLTAEVAICACSSIIPAVTYLLVASIILAFLALMFLPILAIVPFFNKISVFTKTSSFSPVQIVAFLIKMVSCFGLLRLPKPTLG